MTNGGMWFHIVFWIAQWSIREAQEWYFGAELEICIAQNHIITIIIIISPLERRPASLRLFPTVIASEFHVKFEFIALLRRTSAGTIAEVTLKIAGHSIWFIFGRL